MKAARIALVMPVLNGEAYLQDALESVLGQRFPGSVEIVVADGGSTDNTLDILSVCPVARIVSRSDDGLYDGLNKALAHIGNADLVGFLNSDDQLPEGALSALVEAASNAPDAPWLSGDVEFRGENDVVSTSVQPGRLSVEGALLGIPAINARFLTTRSFSELGPFDTRFGLAADKAFVTKMSATSMRGVAVNYPLYRYRYHDDSLTLSRSKAGAVRVHHAEAQMAEYLAGSEQPEVASAADALLQACRAKLIRHGDWAKGLPSPMLLPSVLLKWRKWRGRLSGY
ncbi:MAG: glycosyltransferase [Ahrensia sp.]|nr:glycosyltransferase [Ahrensia sp.]